MGQPEVAEKYKNPATQVGGSRGICRPIRARSAAVGHEILRPRSSGGGAPPCLVCVQ